MHKLTALGIAVLAAAATAQSPLVTLTGGTNQGNIGNNIFFDLQVLSTVTINRLDCYTGLNTVASATGGLEIFLGPPSYVNNHLNAALWTSVGLVTGLTVNPNQFVTVNLTSPIGLGPGNYGVALRSINFNHGYSNGTGCTGTLPGQCANSTFTTNELILRAGANQNTPWSTGLNLQRVWNGQIHYTPGGTPIAVASWNQYGRGCYANYHSFYESHLNPSTTYDMGTLSGTNSLRLTNIGSGYVVGPFVQNTGTWFTPTGAAVPLALANNAVANITPPFAVLYPMPGGPQVSTSLEVSENGCVSPTTSNPSGGNAPAASPQNAFLAGHPRWANWYDFNLSAGGQILYEANPNNQEFYVTWLAVPDNTTTGTNTWQLAFFVNGDVEFRWQAMSHATGGVQQALVGWTPGGNALNPGDTDISAITTPFVTGPVDREALTLGMSARPILGSNPQFQTTNIPAGTQVVTWLFGYQQFLPGQELSALGMPGCFAHLNYQLAFNSDIVVAPGSSASQTFVIPNRPLFNGVLLYAQSATLTPSIPPLNPLGVLTSNGVRMVVGTL